MFYNAVQRTEKCLTFTSFIFIFVRVTRKSNPDGGMEAMGDWSGPMAFPFLGAIGAQPYGFLFLIGESGSLRKEI